MYMYLLCHTVSKTQSLVGFSLRPRPLVDPLKSTKHAYQRCFYENSEIHHSRMTFESNL